MNDIEALRESERWLEDLRRYRIAADDPDQSDALVDAALLAVREKLARLAASAPDVEVAIREKLHGIKIGTPTGWRWMLVPEVNQVIASVRPFLRPALTETQIDEALVEVVDLGDDAKYGYFLMDIYDALRHLGLLAPKVTP